MTAARLVHLPNHTETFPPARSLASEGDSDIESSRKPYSIHGADRD